MLEYAVWEVKFTGNYPGLGRVRNVSFFFLTESKVDPPNQATVAEHIHRIARRDNVKPVGAIAPKYVGMATLFQ